MKGAKIGSTPELTPISMLVVPVGATVSSAMLRRCSASDDAPMPGNGPRSSASARLASVAASRSASIITRVASRPSSLS